MVLLLIIILAFNQGINNSMSGSIGYTVLHVEFVGEKFGLIFT